MGLYDTIYSLIDIELPGLDRPMELQTKGLGNNMSHYVLKENGQLFEKIVIWLENGEYVHPKKFSEAEEVPSDFFGDIRVITCDAITALDHDKGWWPLTDSSEPWPNQNNGLGLDYVLRFEEGQLKKVREAEGYSKWLDFEESRARKLIKDKII
jgi:hypothetical protein